LRTAADKRKHVCVAVLGDRQSSYETHYQKTLVANPGCFASGFSFMLYTPAERDVEILYIDQVDEIPDRQTNIYTLIYTHIRSLIDGFVCYELSLKIHILLYSFPLSITDKLTFGHFCSERLRRAEEMAVTKKKLKDKKRKDKADKAAREQALDTGVIALDKLSKKLSKTPQTRKKLQVHLLGSECERWE